MQNLRFKSAKYLIVPAIILGLILAVIPAKAAIDPATGQYRLDPVQNSNSGTSSGTDGQVTAPQAFNPLGAIFSAILGTSSGTITADPVVTIVRVPGTKEIYRIVQGKKHLILTQEIFYSYGLSDSLIQPISAKELSKYPMVRLFKVSGDLTETVYYLTDGGLIRPMLNPQVFLSYGDRYEDIIIINQKEFNYYPRNQFVYVERPDLSNDVYQISGGVKRYITPMAVKRMEIKEGEVAPINIFEFDFYPTGDPVLF